MTLENPSSTAPAVLFIASDEPALAAFGLLRRAARTPGGDLVKLG
jgi:gentisate 1,2-dioxygenase